MEKISQIIEGIMDAFCVYIILFGINLGMSDSDFSVSSCCICFIKFQFPGSFFSS